MSHYNKSHQNDLENSDSSNGSQDGGQDFFTQMVERMRRDLRSSMPGCKTDTLHVKRNMKDKPHSLCHRKQGQPVELRVILRQKKACWVQKLAPTLPHLPCRHTQCPM
ncbi:hypothetical protein Btru_032542 [Bulinus truncatus]|nr:hypothetical protein Btru_032542 [Bulinus truncatus]